MNAMPPRRLPRALLILLLAYWAATLLHFAHNAEFLAEYPNMPAWLTRTQVYGTWLGITAIGILGCLLVHFGRRLAGLLVIAVYAAIGFDGLAHYSLAPVSAHTLTMNATIWIEVFAAALLLTCAVVLLAKRPQAR